MLHSPIFYTGGLEWNDWIYGSSHFCLHVEVENKLATAMGKESKSVSFVGRLSLSRRILNWRFRYSFNLEYWILCSYLGGQKKVLNQNGKIEFATQTLTSNVNLCYILVRTANPTQANKAATPSYTKIHFHRIHKQKLCDDNHAMADMHTLSLSPTSAKKLVTSQEVRNPSHKLFITNNNRKSQVL